MGRPAKAWRLHRKPGRRCHSVKFTFAGRSYELGTGEEDESLAARKAAEIYASVVKGTRGPGKRKSSDSRDLGPASGEWLATLTLDTTTLESYARYVKTHFVPFFKTVETITAAKVGDYIRARLRVVLSSTVKKERGALKQLAEFAGLSTRDWPEIPKRATGTRSKHGGKGRVDLSPDEVARILAGLPERRRARGDNARLAKRGLRPSCTAGHAVRARYVLMYETSLRPETLDLLRVPEHFTRGATHLTITDEIDKARFGRQLPLSARAREALDAIAPDVGLVFGRFRNPKTLRNAARAAGLDEARASRLTPYDFRRARLTHLADAGQLTAAQWIAGHKRISTTAIYARGSLRAAEEAIK